jgi:hypothetical protein
MKIFFIVIGIACCVYVAVSVLIGVIEFILWNEES